MPNQNELGITLYQGKHVAEIASKLRELAPFTKKGLAMPGHFLRDLSPRESFLVGKFRLLS